VLLFQWPFKHLHCRKNHQTFGGIEMTSVKEFCKKHDACKGGYKWGLKYETMERVFSDGDDGGHIVWAVTREGVLTDRELRLFACFCARQNWHLLTDDRSKHAIEVAERYADGLATDDDLAAASAAARDAARAAQIKWLRENTKPNFGAGLEESK
jgi:hypothetical protein